MQDTATVTTETAVQGEETTEALVTEEEPLIEEVSIDGMCGVY